MNQEMTAMMATIAATMNSHLATKPRPNRIAARISRTMSRVMSFTLPVGAMYYLLFTRISGRAKPVRAESPVRAQRRRRAQRVSGHARSTREPRENGPVRPAYLHRFALAGMPFSADVVGRQRALLADDHAHRAL